MNTPISPYPEELLLGMAHSISFTDFSRIISENNLSKEAAESLAEKVDEVHIGEIIDLIKSLSPDVPYFLHALISKLPKLDYEEVENIFLDTQIDPYLQLKFALKISDFPIDILESFLRNTNIHYIVRRRVAERIQLQVDISRITDDYTPSPEQEYLGKQVNQWQFRELTAGVSHFPLHKEMVPDSRTLNFYYRGGQGAFEPHFEVIVQVLNELIGKKYFQVWDVFRILTRSSTEKIIGGIQTSRSHGLDFRAENAIFADTIHMTHGTPENIAGSHPIVGKGLYKSSSKLRNHSYRKGEYSRIPLLYDRGSKTVSNRGDYGLGYPVDMTIEEVCDLVIRSLKNAESRIIEQSGV